MSNNAIVHIVDDDDGARESLEFLLRSAKFEVRTYDSAKGFLSVISTIKSGCLITDVRMPEISGIDLLRKVRELDIRIPVIVITNFGQEDNVKKAFTLGAEDFVLKYQTTPAELAKKIKDTLSKSKQT